MVILYFCREARGAALPLRSPGFPAPEEGQGCPGECARVWGQSVIILCHVAVAGCLGVPGGEVSLAGCEAVSLRDKLSWAGGVIKDLWAQYTVLWRERGLRLCLKVVTKGQGVGTEAKQGGVLMHRSWIKRDPCRWEQARRRRGLWEKYQGDRDHSSIHLPHPFIHLSTVRMYFPEHAPFPGSGNICNWFFHPQSWD